MKYSKDGQLELSRGEEKRRRALERGDSKTYARLSREYGFPPEDSTLCEIAEADKIVKETKMRKHKKTEDYRTNVLRDNEFSKPEYTPSTVIGLRKEINRLCFKYNLSVPAGLWDMRKRELKEQYWNTIKTLRKG